MSIKKDYFRYLDHFKKTHTIRDMHRNKSASNMIGLRHDVDYDLDLALEMAYWEKENGFRATYYLLHTAPYWQDERLVEKCLQLQDFGHEVGLHLNVMTEWMKGRINSIDEHLKSLLAPLERGGVKIYGASAHGDKLCYERQFINYWIFRDLKPADCAAEHGKSAEGIPVTDERFQIRYPEDHKLVREDGAVLPLWQHNLADYGLKYIASHVPYDQYFTDSGGQWRRSIDPLEADLSFGRHQVLIHPIYWRGEKKMYFFLSTARSGSKWLVRMLNEATALTAKHEFTLNHRYSDQGLVEDKRTGYGFSELMEPHQEQAVKKLMLESRAFIEDLPNDYGEANVYLAHFPKQLKALFPDFAYVHLHRDPKDVVRSIMNRDWYDIPEDFRHPAFPIEGWHEMSQFEKACWYVRLTNEAIMDLTSTRVSFKEMTRSLGSFGNMCRRLGIPFYKRLAEPIFHEVVNANAVNDFPAYSDWSPEQRQIYHQICDPINRELHYKTVGFKGLLNLWRNRVLASKQSPTSIHVAARDYPTMPILDLSPDNGFQLEQIGYKGCTLRLDEQWLVIEPDQIRNVTVLLGGGEWYSITEEEGWEPIIPYYYRGQIEAEVTGGRAELFCLIYDGEGKLAERKTLGQLRGGTHHFSYKIKSNVNRYNLALYMNKASLPEQVVISRVNVEAVPLG